MINHIHHINFLVNDLDLAVSRYQDMLGLGDVIYDDLPKRAVKTARFRIGQSWLVLVQPLDETSAPARHMREYGEGFFLLSLASDNLQHTLSNIAHNGGKVDQNAVRSGLSNWQVADLDIDQFFGAQLQIAEEKI